MLEELVSETIPNLHLKLATIYDNWSLKNHQTMLKLDSTLMANKIELDKITLQNDLLSQKLEECKDTLGQEIELSE